ncbi:MAG: hypothetical protein AAFU03_09500 [Bacteroidota bacterium]
MYLCLMKKLIIGLLLIFCVATSTQAQDANLWKTLSKITFEKKYDELLGFKVDVPVFGDAVKELEGKEVTVSGYIVPVEGYKSHEEFVFSAYPYNMCFFCGGAGPETVMEVTATEAVKYTTERIVLRGKLLLNKDNINRLMYILVDAEQVTETGRK